MEKEKQIDGEEFVQVGENCKLTKKKIETLFKKIKKNCQLIGKFKEKNGVGENCEQSKK
jgi:hypothetical protein